MPYRVDPKAHTKGWARLVVHQDNSRIIPDTQHIYEGVFTLDSETYHIQPIASYKLSKRFYDPEIASPSARPSHQKWSSTIIYKLSDQKSGPAQNLRKREFGDGRGELSNLLGNRHKEGTCGTEGLGFNKNITATKKLSPYAWDDQGDYQRLNKRAPTEGTAGCPTSRKVMYMGVAADCAYVAYKKGIEEATKSILSNWNIASGVYESTFNIALGVVKLEVRSEVCPSTPDSTIAWNRGCSDAYNINDRLNDFTRWRGTLGEDGTGLWHLMTKCSSGPKVGVAWLDQACVTSTKRQNNDYVSGTGVSSATAMEWKVVAHEIGHNFGAKHDCINSQCPCTNCDCCPCDGTCDCKGQYLMNPTSDMNAKNFSPCSIRDICSNIPNIGQCLEGLCKVYKSTIRESMCGNGIKEPGEECDCGTSVDCPCCTPQCKLKPGAVCSDDGDECCKDCQLKPANTTCRPAQSECDIVEMCNGVSPTCPTDTYIEDGKDCGASGSGLKCASGQCTSRDAQCAARGQRMGITKACTSYISADPCQFVCNSPERSNACVIMQGQFIDGTTCGLSGKCLKGVCQSGNMVDSVRSWFDQNRALSIALISIGAAIALCCLWSCCCRRVKRKRTVIQTTYPPSTRYDAGYVDPTLYNGPPPPTVYYPPNTHQNSFQHPTYPGNGRQNDIPLTNIRQ
ncbi:zincin [Basidiobolus meristosporus CBS 931.73]|uniref:Disintegrin and metalloproteinase domain-containing protein B n=1 Tax=Basidiobolus meristosporus CBS 931.73 TaxID=1314790 RepID=A0A1Y1Y287_9FUNG|nr:zincin [Basidiobolus meristosporus CBS 931.73]|eukprot:ORX92127.1 zincin [Basidiobolus meristosporus CBS 931.73]